MGSSKAIIVTIGDELVSGYRLDTNSKWLSRELFKINISVSSIISIGDDEKKIVKILSEVSQKNVQYVLKS